MNTNDAQIISQIAQTHGWNLSGQQVTGLIVAGGIVVRWLRQEINLAYTTWRNIGGWQGLKSFARTGKTILPNVSADKPKENI